MGTSDKPFRSGIVAWAYRRLRHEPEPATRVEIARVESALQSAMGRVYPTESFRVHLGESLSMAAHSRAAGVTVQQQRRIGRWALFAAAMATLLSITGLTLLMRRIVR